MVPSRPPAGNNSSARYERALCGERSSKIPQQASQFAPARIRIGQVAAVADGGSWLYFVSLGAIFVFAGWLRFRYLGLSQLWLDEIWTAETIKGGPLAVVKFTLKDQGPLPVAYLLPWLSWLFVRSDFMLRFPDALFGLLTVPLAASTARRLSRSRTAALASSLFMAVSEHHIWYSRDARGYAVLAFMSLLAFRFLLEGLETGRRRWLVGVGLCGLVGHYTSYFYCFAPAGLAVWGGGWLFYAARRRELDRPEIVRRAKGLAVSILLPALLFAPWLIAAAKAAPADAPALTNIDTKGLIGVWLDRVAYAWLPVPWGWRIAVTALIVAGDRMLIPERKGLLILTVLAPVLAASDLFALSTEGHALAPRYLIAALPLFYIGAGLGAAAIVQFGSRTGNAAGAGSRRLPFGFPAMAAAASLLALNGYAQLRNYWAWSTMQKQDWKQAFSILEKRFGPRDLIVPGIEGTFLPVDYYLPPKLKPFVVPADWGTAKHMTQTLGTIESMKLRLWYVVPGYAISDDPDMKEWFAENFDLVAVVPGCQSTVCLFYGPRKPDGAH